MNCIEKMKYTISESRLLGIIHEAVNSALNGDMTGERFDEILRQNNVTVDDLIDVLPGIDVEQIVGYLEDDKTPDEDSIRESWEERVYDSKEFENFVRNLGGLTRQDVYAIDGYSDAWYCESGLVQRAFQKMYEQACEDAELWYQDNLDYRSDPLGYFGVNQRDFV